VSVNCAFDGTDFSIEQLIALGIPTSSMYIGVFGVPTDSPFFILSQEYQSEHS
jgi:hypothetical protein